MLGLSFILNIYSNMKNALNSVKVAAPAVNAFNLSHDVKLSCQMGQLVPVLAMEVIPGDRIRLGAENLVRLAPMLAPMMHRVDVRVEYFFSPNRLVWDKWETWISNGGSEPDPVDPLPAHPFILYNSDGSGSPAPYEYNRLMDYMGLPRPDQCPDPTHGEKVSALPFAHYQKIYDDYYRDENLQESNFEGLNDGYNNDSELVNLRYRAWEADYFTKALPFAQKGQPVDLPLGTVEVDTSSGLPGRFVKADGSFGAPFGDLSADSFTGAVRVGDSGSGSNVVGVYDPQGTLTVGATTINDLRLAYRLQEWLEKNARGGTRYAELIRSHFNVRPEDARLQRPEYIVGVKNPIQISEVLNTTGGEDLPQGNMAGHGVGYDRGNFGKYFATEHGYVIGILSIMPKTCYQQGIPRHFLKYEDPTQLAWPTFANLGEQEIQNREIMAFRPGNVGEATFGYMARYQEYKGLTSRVCGDFRTTLDFWHMGRIFDPLFPPSLNSSFVKADPTQRVFAVEDPLVDQLYCQVMHHITVVRALPVYGTPTF